MIRRHGPRRGFPPCRLPPIQLSVHALQEFVGLLGSFGLQEIAVQISLIVGETISSEGRFNLLLDAWDQDRRLGQGGA